MKRGEEGDIGMLAERVAQSQRSMGRQLGHQAVGDRLQAIVFLGLRCRLDVHSEVIVLMLRARRDGTHAVFELGIDFWLNRPFVFGADIAALDAQVARSVDADEGAGARDLRGIEDHRPIVEARERRLELPEPFVHLFGQFVGIVISFLQPVELGLERVAGRLYLLGVRELLAAEAGAGRKCGRRGSQARPRSTSSLRRRSSRTAARSFSATSMSRQADILQPAAVVTLEQVAQDDAAGLGIGIQRR